MQPTRVSVLTLLAMTAFAANSLLCRLALKHTAIDAASFTLLRIFSGAVVLGLIAIARIIQSSRGSTGMLQPQGSWPSALALFAYAAAFSFAYLTLSAGTGALLLFGAVQATMILWGIREGERLGAPQLFGLALALGGLVVLVSPGITAPPLGGSILMLVAGIAWGIYSLRGKTARDPLRATTGNFLRALPFAVILSVALVARIQLDRAGMGYALLSGAVASGLGYVIWYAALPSLSAATAASVQLSVPVLAAIGGILLLGEALTVRLAIASVAVLGGIAVVVTTPPSPMRKSTCDE